MSPTPLPPNRGRWRITLHAREFTPVPWQQTMISELLGARGRRLERQLNAPATATFSLEGRSVEAGLIKELQHDVVFWRWDEAAGKDLAYFRGIIGQAVDQLSGPTDTHVVTFTCHDYAAMLGRRYVTTTLNYNNVDQDMIVVGLVGVASASTTTGGGTSFSPGSYLPLNAALYQPNGTGRGNSGEIRVRNYLGSQEILSAIDDLANVQSMANPIANAFDYDVAPLLATGYAVDLLRVFYPNQGITRTEPLEYGGALASVTRTVQSADYANFVRVLGNNGTSDPAAAQLKAEAWNSDANNVGVVPIGLFMDASSAASDASTQATLDETAAGLLNLHGVLVPSYTLGLTPNTYVHGQLNMGDTVPVVINSGTRLAVNTTMRIVGMSWDISEDGTEDVSLTVGRPRLSLANLLNTQQKSVAALARR